MFQVFILCSGVAALTNLLVGHLLYGVLGMDGSFSYPLAVALAFLSGMVVSFVLNRKFTFAASGRSVFQELRDFTFVSAGGLAITTGLAFVLREYMSSGLVLLTNARVAPENAAHVIAVGLTAIYSFFGHKLVSFGDGTAVNRLARIGGAPLIMCAVVAAMVLTRPFRGIDEVGLLYAAQALNTAGLADLSGDPFFAFGNQGSFSVFNVVYAQLIKSFGLAQAALILWGCAIGLWASGIWRLAGTMTHSVALQGGMVVATLALFPGYGPMNIGYAENLPIPRVFAEALSLHALCYAVRNRFVTSGLVLVAAAAVHPIMAAVSGAVWLHLLVGRTVLFTLICCLGLVVALVLGVLGISPFSWLLSRYDSEWFSLIHFKNMLVFPLTWEAQALLGLVFPATMIALTLRHGNSASMRFAKALVVAAVFMMVLSVVGSDLLGNRLITVIQTWRVLYLVAVFASLMLVPRLLELGKNSVGFWLLVAAAVASAVEAQFRIIPVSSGVLSMSFALTHFVGIRFKGVAWVRFPAILVGALAMANVLFIASGMTGTKGFAPVLVLFCIALLGLAVWRSRTGGAPILLVAAATVGAIFLVDARSPSAMIATEAGAFDPELSRELAGKSVYWESGLGYLWLGLRQSSFHSCLQTSGISFFREQAVETRRRAEALRALNTIDFYPNPNGRCLQKADPSLNGPSSLFTLEQACSELPALDIIITRQAPVDANLARLVLNTEPVVRFGLARPGDSTKEEVFYMYECARPGA